MIGSHHTVLCQKKQELKEKTQIPVFKEVDPSQSGIRFLNLTPGPPELKKKADFLPLLAEEHPLVMLMVMA